MVPHSRLNDPVSQFPMPRRARLLDRLVLGSYVKPMEWGYPSADMPTPGPDVAQSIIDCWNHFNKKDSSVVHMRELYPKNLRIPVVDSAEEYSILFPIYMDKKSYQRVAEDGMFMPTTTLMRRLSWYG